MNALATPPRTPEADPTAELLRCDSNAAYFIDSYCQIYDATARAWVRFALWAAQILVVRALLTGDNLIILKARQLGLTWLILAYILWLMLFRPAATALLFSRRQEEAYHLLERLKGMYSRLPPWLQAYGGGVVTDSASVWALANGSAARGFPTSAGDSYTASIALADEFDIVEDQDRLINAVQPTIDGGGQLVLLSRVDKRRPDTAFKRLYQAAKAGLLAGWRAIFLPWHARPGRTAAWYADRTAESLHRTGTLDDVQEQYPATDAEALAQPTGDKRLPPAWLLACYAPGTPITPPDAPAYATLTIYAPPVPGAAYVIGADPAEGNPHSDDSAATVLDKRTGAEVAVLCGKIEPTQFARQLIAVALYYNRAQMLVERNNHGHTVIAGIGGLALPGTDGRPGWLTTAPSKAALYDSGAVAFREGDALIRSLATYTQLGSIEGNSLSAPAGQHDDRAMSFMLALQARVQRAAATARQYNYLERESA